MINTIVINLEYTNQNELDRYKKAIKVFSRKVNRIRNIKVGYIANLKKKDGNEGCNITNIRREDI